MTVKTRSANPQSPQNFSGMKAAKTLLAGLLLLHPSLPAYAVITSASFDTNIPYETLTPNSTTITYNTSTATNISINIYHLNDVTDTPGPSNQVASLPQTNVGVGVQHVPWDGLWPVKGVIGRQDGLFKIIVKDDVTGQQFALSSFLNITSVDIHGVSVAPSFDSNQNPALPYIISYSLAKDSKVTVKVLDSVGTLVRTLALDAAQYGETVKPTPNRLLWNGLNDAGRPVPLDVYTVTIDAKDPLNADTAIQRTGTASIQSLASLDSDAKQTFDNNAFVYPNPIRVGNSATTCGMPACFQFLAVRANATITLKIYTIAGDLVRDEKFPNLTTGNIVNFNWDVTNQSGKGLGRGLYYFVAKEEDSEGTLQTVKKMAVIR